MGGALLLAVAAVMEPPWHPQHVEHWILNRDETMGGAVRGRGGLRDELFGDGVGQ